MAAARTTTAKPPEQTQLEQLAAEFPGSAIKARSQGGKELTYVSIDGTIRRLNDVLGPNWSTEASTKVIPVEGNKYFAVTELHFYATVDGVKVERYGVGAMVNPDPDMAAKTALAEAIKKAGHSLGIALYLWDADGRARATSRMNLAANSQSEAALKKAAFDLATQKLGTKPATAAEAAKALGVPAGALADKDQLIAILTEAGVL